MVHVECGWLDTDRIGSIERAHGYSTQQISRTKEPFLYTFFLYFLNFIRILLSSHLAYDMHFYYIPLSPLL